MPCTFRQFNSSAGDGMLVKSGVPAQFNIDISNGSFPSAAQFFSHCLTL